MINKKDYHETKTRGYCFFLLPVAAAVGTYKCTNEWMMMIIVTDYYYNADAERWKIKNDYYLIHLSDKKCKKTPAFLEFLFLWSL